MDYSTWMFALLVGTTIIGSALAYGMFSNRRCNSELELTQQDRMNERSWRKELLRD